MKRHTATRAATGIVLLALAVGAALLSQGVADAAREFRVTQAHWQYGVVAAPPKDAGRVREVAETVLGVRARSEVMRAYLDYRVRLASVIPGTVFPQTQARWNAISTIGRLRGSQTSARDRAAVDVTLGLVYAASALASGPTVQRQSLQRNAVAAFRRAVLEDSTNAEAKYDLEVLLAAQADAQARARSTGSGRQQQEGKPNATPHSQPEGTGY